VQDDFFEAGIRHIIKPVPNKRKNARKQEGKAVSIFPKHITDYFASTLEPIQKLIWEAADHLRLPKSFQNIQNEELASQVNMKRVYKMVKDQMVAEFLQKCTVDVFASNFITKKLRWVEAVSSNTQNEDDDILIFDGEEALTSSSSIVRFKNEFEMMMQRASRSAAIDFASGFRDGKAIVPMTAGLTYWERAIRQPTEQNAPKPTITFEGSQNNPLDFRLRVITDKCQVLKRPNSQQSILHNLKRAGYVHIEKIAFEHLVLYQREPGTRKLVKTSEVNNKNKKGWLKEKQVSEKFVQILEKAKYDKHDVSDAKCYLTVFFAKQ